MSILLCHNYYQQRGGEDQSFEDEAALLESKGHEVIRYTRHNDDIDGMGSLSVARQTLWSRHTYQALRKLLARHRPQVMHCTNTFPLISPSAYYAARDEGVPVVQALRNYRFLCPKAQFLRADRVCEDCLGRRIPWPAIAHKCYKESRTATAVVTALVGWQRLSGMWHKRVNRFYTLSEFSRSKFIEGGLPADRIDVKPNFVAPDPGVGTGQGGYAVYVGRLSAEKGVATLLEAWSHLEDAIPLQIVGDGPLAEQVRDAAARHRCIKWLGRLPLDEVCRVVGEAACLVMPSIWYETFGRTIIEAYSVGTPPIVSRLGAMAELVDDGRTGMLFSPGDVGELVGKLRQMMSDSSGRSAMRREARAEYEAKFTPDANYRALISIYESAVGKPLLDGCHIASLGGAVRC